VATHNHFVLDRGGKVFKQTAPIVKLAEGATEEDHLALLGYLNSSTACFWMKQVFQPKHSAEHKTHPEPERNRYEHAGESMRELPVAVPADGAQIADRLSQIASTRADLLAPDLDLDGQSASLRAALQNRWRRWDETREQMLVLQEELDWRVYCRLGFASPSVALPNRILLESVLHCPRGSRPFEQLSPRKSFVRARDHLVPLSDAEFPPIHDVSPELLDAWRARREAISTSSALRLIECALFKRQWRDTDDNITEFEFRRQVDDLLLRGLLFDKAEQVVSQCADRHRVLTIREIAQEFATDPKVLVVAELLTGESSPDLERLLTELIGTDAVPHVAALRYTDTGLEKRAVWERTWDLQRREDAGERIDVPVPPKYDSKDFRDQVYWRHRGKLDVAKERFISYPGAESDDDPSPLVGWAGWDHLQQATALAALYQKRKDEDGWTQERLTPLLAGLLEIVPWLKQWHNEPDAKFGGLRQGDFFETFVLGEARRWSLTVDGLRSWRPVRATGRRRPAAASNGSQPRRASRAAVDPEHFLEAVAALDQGEGAEQRAVAEKLGVSPQVASRLAAELVGQGKLVQISTRPRRYSRGSTVSR
jgi:hypothetical protein